MPSIEFGRLRDSNPTAIESSQGVTGNQSIDDSLLDSITDYPFPNETGIDQFDPFGLAYSQDFGTFLDSVPGLASPFSLTHQPLPILFPDTQVEEYAYVEHETQKQVRGDIGIPAAPISTSKPTTIELSLSRYSSRLPSLSPEDIVEVTAQQQDFLKKRHRLEIIVSTECRQSILAQLTEFSGCVSADFVLPSRHALSRLIGGYFQNFHDHYPFFHPATLRVESLKAELFLAIAALGARYTREPDIGVELYRVARAVVMERISRRHAILSQGSSTILNENVHECAGADTLRDQAARIELMQTLLLLIAVASWYKHEPAAQDALSIRSVLHSITQEHGKSAEQDCRPEGWEAWTRMEATKRTLLVVYCFFNIHTILFDLPPMMLATELKVDLPCSEQEWKASSEAEWFTVQSDEAPSKQDFRKTYNSLFASNIDVQLNAKGFSALGGYALIHAIIQQIWLLRNGRMPIREQYPTTLSHDEMKAFERALKRWTGLWERNHESSMDPLSPHGPLTFTSTALLRLAYIRLNMDLGPVRSLNSWDPQTVARSLHQSPGARRGDPMTRAALHCAHALSIPVKLGINYVAQTQVIRWSNQHALCSLECAVLLAKWLEAVTIPDASLDSAEQRVLEFTAQLVAESDYKMSSEQLLLQRQQLSGRVVKLWAKLYQAKSVWQTVDLIGASLNIYADLLGAGH